MSLDDRQEEHEDREGYLLSQREKEQEDSQSNIWNEAYELHANLTDLNDEELLSVRSCMKERCERIMEMEDNV